MEKIKEKELKPNKAIVIIGWFWIFMGVLFLVNCYLFVHFNLFTNSTTLYNHKNSNNLLAIIGDNQILFFTILLFLGISVIIAGFKFLKCSLKAKLYLEIVSWVGIFYVIYVFGVVITFFSSVFENSEIPKSPIILLMILLILANITIFLTPFILIIRYLRSDKIVNTFKTPINKIH